MAAADESEGGLTLAQFAAVRAGIAEPFPLDDVLGIEGIDAAVWAEADVAWTARVASDPAAMSAYEKLLAAAEDRLARKVDPIATDVEAWLGFLAEYASLPSPTSLLDKRGLGLNDLARLSRAWDQRFEREPALQKRAAEIRRRGVKKVPPLEVGPRRLRASDAAAAAERSRAAPPAVRERRAAAASSSMELERYARLAAELIAATPPERAAVLARFELTADAHAALEEGYRRRLGADAAMAADFARLRDHHRARIAARRAPPGREAPPSTRAWSFDEPGTFAADRAGAKGPAFPFGVEPSKEFVDVMRSQPPSVPGSGSDGGTVALPSPFASNEIDDAPTVIRASPFASPLVADVGTSAPVPSPFADKPLPFEAPSDAPPEVVERVEPLPPRFDSGTVSAVISPFAADATTPFADRDRSASRPPLPPPRPPPKRRPAIEAAPVSTRAPVSTPSPLSSRAPLSADGRAPMTLERHAALCAEVAIQPGHEAAVLARNGVDAELKARADGFWRGQAAKDPAARAAWTRAFDSYHAMFSRGR